MADGNAYGPQVSSSVMAKITRMKSLLVKVSTVLLQQTQRVLGYRRIREASKLSLGDSGRRWTGFVTAGLTGEVRLDITGQLPDWMIGRYQFIWSERMLEHISMSDLPATFSNISLLLKTGGRCRMCLPICFWGTPNINMVRVGNEENCRRQGHLTWFTYKGYGLITKTCMGAVSPPEELVTFWAVGLDNSGLIYQPIRHYEENGSLFTDESILTNGHGGFTDEPLIEVARPDSLIFDLVKA